MTDDAARSRVVLFGGTSATSDMSDTWEWDGEAWTQMENAGPAPRTSHAMSATVTARVGAQPAVLQVISIV